MTSTQQFRTFLWDIDPGYFRLRQALKTVLALLITLWIVRDYPLVTKIVACSVCGFSMQGVVARSFVSQFFHVLLFDIVYFAVFMLGLFIRNYPELKALVFILLGFSVNYIRRFGLQNSMAPVMAWMLCFLATVLPFNFDSDLWTHIQGLIIGLLVGSVVYLVVYPEDYPTLFVNNSNRLFKLLAFGMIDTRRYLLKRAISQSFEREKFVLIKKNINHLIDSNLAINQNDVFSVERKEISEVLIHQYALVHAYSVMLESYRILKIHDYHLSPALRLALSTINKQFIAVFKSLSMSSDYSVHTTHTAVPLALLAEKFSKDELVDTSLVMALLNLKLSFNLFNQHIVALVRVKNGH